MSERSISVQYGEAVASFVELARALDADEWATHVPCTPLWTVRDVLSHVAGIPDDAANGRPIDPSSADWTAGQIERERDKSVDELLARWLEQAEFFGQAVEAMGEARPPFDCHSHEHDVRQAIGKPGNRDSQLIDDSFELLTGSLTDTELPVALDITVDGEPVQQLGDRNAGRNVKLVTSKFEIFRSRLGRRTPAQVGAYDWSGAQSDIDVVLGKWFTFGPSEITIDE